MYNKWVKNILGDEDKDKDVFIIYVSQLIEKYSH